MTKEGLIFRTEEIKAEIKKNLKSIEEILFFLIKENNLERFHISLESRNNKRSTLLIFAVQCGYDIFVKYLLEKGDNINAQDFEINTALHYVYLIIILILLIFYLIIKKIFFFLFFFG